MATCSRYYFTAQYYCTVRGRQYFLFSRELPVFFSLAFCTTLYVLRIEHCCRTVGLSRVDFSPPPPPDISSIVRAARRTARLTVRLGRCVLFSTLPPADRGWLNTNGPASAAAVCMAWSDRSFRRSTSFLRSTLLAYHCSLRRTTVNGSIGLPSSARRP